ncbi:MAG: hypothetical protein LBT40_12560 [Deltaproteobacteria bacterium]|jgi:hypothetical protein|nr:hypothetical protein [Deltaproteobacteria bacterium]
MATTNGTASGAAELWDILLAFVGDNGWDTLDQGQTSTASSAVKAIQLRGTDVSGQGNIYVHMMYMENTLQDLYSFGLEGSAGWLPDSDVMSYGRNPMSVSSIYVPLHRNPIEYWLTASPRRFMGAFRHNDRWGSMYCGFILPYGMPGQWAYPLWIAGNNLTTQDYKVNTGGCPWGASSVPSGWLYCPSGRWQATPTASGPSGGRGYGIQIWPYSMYPTSDYPLWYKPLKDRTGVERYPITNMIFYCLNGNESGTFGEPDGLCHVTSWGASGGDILTYGGREYLLIQRELSTANNTSAAMLLE